MAESLFPVAGVFYRTLRTQQAQELSAWLLDLGGEGIILGGDFNSLPLAGADRHLRQYFSDALSISLQQYFTGTYWGLPIIRSSRASTLSTIHPTGRS